MFVVVLTNLLIESKIIQQEMMLMNAHFSAWMNFKEFSVDII